jgi:hypothetical protein
MAWAKTRIAVAAGLMLVLGINSYGQTAGKVSDMRESHWQQDLDFFETNLPQKEIAFYQLMPKEKFEQEMADIKYSVPQLSDQEIVLRLMRLVASLGVGHSWVVLPKTGPMAFHHYPLELHWFSDGLVVVAAAPEYQEGLGARVVRFGTMTPEQLETNLAPYISYENKVWMHSQSSSFMKVTELLQSLKVADADGRVELTLAKPDSKTFTVWVSPAKTNSLLIKAADALHIPPTLYSKRDDFYWYDYLTNSSTLYIQYRVCDDDPQNPFTNFTKEVFAFADSHHVERTVVDLHFNGGGDSEIAMPLLDGIKSRPALNTKGHLFVLIGPMTFSSGEWTAEEFHNSFDSMTSESKDGFYWFYSKKAKKPHSRFNATFIGGPTGGKPNCFGEVHTFELPNSKLNVGYAIKHFQLTTEGDPPWREPDILVTSSWEDYLAGHDPVLEAVLRQPLP